MLFYSNALPTFMTIESSNVSRPALQTSSTRSSSGTSPLATSNVNGAAPIVGYGGSGVLLSIVGILMVALFLYAMFPYNL
jgi:hypothetical protein